MCDTQQFEAALRKLKWLLPRAARAPEAGWEDGYNYRMYMTTCLMQLDRHEEAVPVVLEAVQQRRKMYPDDHREVTHATKYEARLHGQGQQERDEVSVAVQ